MKKGRHSIPADNIPANILKCMSKEDRRRYEKDNNSVRLSAADQKRAGEKSLDIQGAVPKFFRQAIVWIQPYSARSRDAGGSDHKYLIDAFRGSALFPDDKPAFISRYVEEAPIKVHHDWQEKTVFTFIEP